MNNDNLSHSFQVVTFFEKKACISLTPEKEYNRELKLTDHPRPE